MIKDGIAELHQYHYQHRVQVMNLLDDGKSYMKSIVDMIEKNIRQLEVSRVQSLGSPRGDEKPEEYECRDVHMATVVESDLLSKVGSRRLMLHIFRFLLCGVYFGYIFMALFSVACGFKKKKKTLLMDENEGFLYNHCTSSSVLSVHSQ